MSAGPPSESTSRSSARRLGAVTLFTATMAALFATYALHSALPANPIELPLERAVSVRDWFPEGWAFFTAPAQHEMRLPFERVGGAWIAANAGPNARASNAFGMRRGPRLQNMEVEILTEQAAAADWTSCDAANASCFDAAPSRAVVNRSHHPTLCGDVVIAVEKPVPWAWSKLGKPVAMPAKVLRMEVRC